MVCLQECRGGVARECVNKDVCTVILHGMLLTTLFELHSMEVISYCNLLLLLCLFKYNTVSHNLEFPAA
jgi:hypothetical protein